MERHRVVALTAAVLIPGMAWAGDWSSLEPQQATVSRAEFERLVQEVYCPSGALTNYLRYEDGQVAIYSTTARTAPPLFTLRFASDPPAAKKIPAVIHRIALDPGHIGGEWARMEERFFERPNDRPVQEGVLTLLVARILKERLETAGFAVVLSRSALRPVTEKRPADFQEEAFRWARSLARFDSWPSLEREAAVADAARQRAEVLFYRHSEIAARASLVNETIKPDLTLCLHFNAAPWDECHNLVADNRLVLFVHGDYLADELTDDDQKLRLFQKLLARGEVTERFVAERIATEMAGVTGLPPVVYSAGDVAVRVGNNPYVYARNLAANRLFNGPVVYLEPYYMNNHLVYQRLQLGDYDGTREINGRPCPSIFREYAEAVAKAVISLRERP